MNGSEMKGAELFRKSEKSFVFNRTVDLLSSYLQIC